MIKMSRNPEGFAVFTDGKYSVAIDGAFNVREKVGVVADAFKVKGKSKAADVATQVSAAITEAGE